MPKVSVCMITYNHEQYIVQALEGVFMQQCDFEIEIILSNDCSTDGTHRVVTDFLSNHNQSGIVKYINNKSNLGIIPNFVFALKQCKGDYVALCDGDDYWTDSLKLKKQVDFLERNLDFSGIATNSLVKYENSSREHLFKNNIKPILKANDLIGARHFHTATFLFRRKAFKDDFPVNILSGDRALFLLVSCFGDIKLDKDVTAVYRKNEGGISRRVISKQMKKDYKIVGYLKKYNRHLNYSKLNAFLAFTVLSYSFKLSMLDFFNAAYKYLYYTSKNEKKLFAKLKSLINGFKFVFKQSKKIVLSSL